ncbi:MAG: hypothetical protein R3B96_15740 [Pirellulaceae bacterium]
MPTAKKRLKNHEQSSSVNVTRPTLGATLALRVFHERVGWLKTNGDHELTSVMAVQNALARVDILLLPPFEKQE